MNNNAKILYICQEATPYLPENDISALCRHPVSYTHLTLPTKLEV